MVKRQLYLVVLAGFLAAGFAGVSAQQRGNSGLPPGPGNPLAALQAQIDALTQQVATLGGAVANLHGAVQGGAESPLFVIRGTVGSNPGPFVLEGAGFTVANIQSLPCDINSYPEYHVTFDQPFSSPPSVVVSARDLVFSPLNTPSNAPVYTAAIDNGHTPGGGGVTINGFSVRIKSDAFGFATTCFGSHTWDFIAIGLR